MFTPTLKYVMGQELVFEGAMQMFLLIMLGFTKAGWPRRHVPKVSKFGPSSVKKQMAIDGLWFQIHI